MLILCKLFFIFNVNTISTMKLTMLNTNIPVE